MRKQLPGINVVDNGSCPPIPDTTLRLEKNGYFVGGWIAFMKTVPPEVEHVWMLNDDVQGVSYDMMQHLETNMKMNPRCGIMTPAFNSPHGLFWAQRGSVGIRQVPWIDWTGPMVNMKFWREMGGFDPDFYGYGADLDICWRGRKAGWYYCVLDTVSFHHIGSVSALRNGVQGIQGDLGRMANLLKMKHGLDWQMMMV